MLTAYFHIQAGAGGGGSTFGKATAFGKGSKQRDKPARQPKARGTAATQREPRGTEASTTSVHAKFVPLPPEDPAAVPRPAELPSQAWQGLTESITRDDDVAEWEDDWEEQEAVEEDFDDASEPDFEPESLEPLSNDNISGSFTNSSMDDDRFAQAFFRRTKPSRQVAQVYSGPMLCCEDDAFDSE